MSYDYKPEWEGKSRVAVAERPSWSRIGGIILPNHGQPRVVKAVSDYTVEGFAVNPPSTPPRAGDAIFLDVFGDVYDRLAGPVGDRWAILLLAAVVDSYGNPTSLKTSEYANSLVHAYPDFLTNSNHIKIGWPGVLHWHAVLGAMPNNVISWAVELFASHSDTLAWDWNLWDISPFYPYY